jgi:hypothetical protein
MSKSIEDKIEDILQQIKELRKDFDDLKPIRSADKPVEEKATPNWNSSGKKDRKINVRP